MDPKYSICMCNYNMADTLERSLTSILEQLDQRYEVLVVDDGSTDDSLDVIKNLQERYENLRLISLQRDRKRKLGFTRNISIKEAKGEYVFLNIDCDDIFGPYIDDFAKVYHQIEKCMKEEFHLKGRNINMGRRNFLLRHGPYRNIFRSEDRDMWARLASFDALVPIMHKNYVTRLPLKRGKKIIKILCESMVLLQNDVRYGSKFWVLLRALLNKNSRMPLKFQLLRAIFLLPAWLSAQFMEPISIPENMSSNSSKFVEYQKKMTGSFSEIMQRHECKPDFSQLSLGGREIFSDETA